MKASRKNILGWIGVCVTVVFASIWAYWGAFENFHEGWYSESLMENLFMFLFQYMSFSIVFVILALVILRWKRFGLLLHIALGIFAMFFFSGASFSVLGILIVSPFLVFGLIYYFGKPEPKKWAYRFIIAIPLIIALVISVPQGIKVSKRIDDRNLGMRQIEGNGVNLVWASRGPGWPDQGVSWEEAQERCAYLNEAGTTLMQGEQNIWRLPSVDEAVRSMMLHGENAGGIWKPTLEKATYMMKPDKESPLWDTQSPIIYYWTADTSIKDPDQVYIITYHGGVFDKMKSNRQDYQSFRAVKDIDEE